VTISIIREDKGSTCNAKAALNEPDSIQLNSVFSNKRASGGSLSKPKKTTIETRNDKPIAPQAMQPTVSLRRFLPINPFIIVPINGNNNTKATVLSIRLPTIS
jgi:hypothetical protein